MLFKAELGATDAPSPWSDGNSCTPGSRRQINTYPERVAQLGPLYNPFRATIHDGTSRPRVSVVTTAWPWGDRGFSVIDPIGNSVYIYSDREPSEEFRQYYHMGGHCQPGFLVSLKSSVAPISPPDFAVCNGGCASGKRQWCYVDRSFLCSSSISVAKVGASSASLLGISMLP